MTTRSLTWGAVAVVAAFSLSACGSSDSDSSDSSGSTDSAAGSACSYPESGQAAKKVDAPPSSPEYDGPVSVDIKTNAGTLKASLDGKGAPCTTNSFVSLAKQGYYDKLDCHRFVKGPMFGVLQCGDPTGTGAGGPGYSFGDELTTAKKQKQGTQGGVIYPAGTLAMANAGPDTNGSQFFVVYTPTELPPAYTVFGTLDKESVKTAQKVADQNPTGDGPFKKKFTLEKVTVAG